MAHIYLAEYDGLLYLTLLKSTSSVRIMIAVNGALGLQPQRVVVGLNNSNTFNVWKYA